MKINPKYLSIFRTSFIQVFLVSVQTIFLMKGIWYGIAVGSFLISYVWVANVKKSAIATHTDQIVYATGAMIGALSGFYFTKLF
jgi:uncharacterized protein YebE (UPF0316 family)